MSRAQNIARAFVACLLGITIGSGVGMFLLALNSGMFMALVTAVVIGVLIARYILGDSPA